MKFKGNYIVWSDFIVSILRLGFWGGNVYEGHWKDDKNHGRGIERWADGSTFKGIYVNGLKEGKGEYKWQNGSSYKG